MVYAYVIYKYINIHLSKVYALNIFTMMCVI